MKCPEKNLFNNTNTRIYIYLYIPDNNHEQNGKTEFYDANKTQILTKID